MAWYGESQTRTSRSTHWVSSTMSGADGREVVGRDDSLPDPILTGISIRSTLPNPGNANFKPNRYCSHQCNLASAVQHYHPRLNSDAH